LFQYLTILKNHPKSYKNHINCRFYPADSFSPGAIAGFQPVYPLFTAFFL
jgi:hypothetical protein